MKYLKKKKSQTLHPPLQCRPAPCMKVGIGSRAGRSPGCMLALFILKRKHAGLFAETSKYKTMYEDFCICTRRNIETMEAKE